MNNDQRISLLERQVRTLKRMLFAAVCVLFSAGLLGMAAPDNTSEVRTERLVFVDPQTGKTIATIAPNKYSGVDYTSPDTEGAISFVCREDTSVIAIAAGTDNVAKLIADTTGAGMMSSLGEELPQTMVFAKEAERERMAHAYVSLYDGKAANPRVEIAGFQASGNQPSAYIQFRDRFGDLVSGTSAK